MFVEDVENEGGGGGGGGGIDEIPCFVGGTVDGGGGMAEISYLGGGIGGGGGGGGGGGLDGATAVSTSENFDVISLLAKGRAGGESGKEPQVSPTIDEATDFQEGGGGGGGG
ncbi:hypothetical protein MtrunA17_Chr4g0061121 [Medicago truncatula]|uniref:Uncharacterized protein n=1 Tax=Medicago truncatula TaxID=3880 RepID=A0A396IDM7_MEDTR|nr:hypothetical protein MtrunA17_Chr4g0061121 [Medicago truncatula]